MMSALYTAWAAGWADVVDAAVLLLPPAGVVLLVLMAAGRAFGHRREGSVTGRRGAAGVETTAIPGPVTEDEVLCFRAALAQTDDVIAALQTDLGAADPGAS